MTKREDTIRGLRELADFLEAHPAVPVQPYHQMDVFLSDKGELATLARMGGWDKNYIGDWFALGKTFAGVSLHMNLERERVCRRVVIGTRTVEAKPAHEEDIVEWMCGDPLLSGDSEAA